VLELRNQSNINLSSYLSTYTTDDETLSIEKIDREKLCTNSKDLSKREGYKRVELWAKVDIKNLSTKERYYIINRYPYIEKIDIYTKKDGKYIKQFSSGASKPYSQRAVEQKIFIFPIDIKINDTTTVYIHTSHYGSLVADFRLYDSVESINYISSYTQLQSLMIGMIAIMLFYHIIVYFITANRHYKDYILMLGAILLYELSIKGYFDAYIYPDSIVDIDKYIIIPSSLLITVTIINFVKNIIHTELSYPKIDKILEYSIYGLILLVLVQIVSTVFLFKSDIYYMTINIVYLSVMVATSIFFASIVYMSIKGEDSAKMVLLIGLQFIVCAILYISSLYGIVDCRYADVIFDISQVLHVILFSIVLIYKIKNIESQNCILQEEALSLKRKLVSKVNEIKENTLIDNLTKLHNRDALAEELQKSEQKSIILVDIDSFKEINELYSVESGNMVLLKMSKILKKIAYENSLDIYRVSADQFIMLDISHRPLSAIDDIIQNIIYSIKKNEFVIEDGVILSIDTTICCVYDRVNVLEEAIIGLNYAKTEHKQLIYYDDSIDIKEHLKHKNEILNEIKIAVENDNFVPFYQPIYDDSGEIVKYEALMRLKIEDHEGVKYLTPYHFLDVAIKSKYYEKMSLSVISKALEKFKNRDELISVNLSYQDIKNAHFIDEFLNLLIDSGIANRVVVEIVESEDITNIELALLFIEKLRELEVKIALDDFGSGYSNFINILKLSPDYIKIDGSLIKHIDTDKGNEELVKAVVQFCKKLKIKTVGEFIHCEDVYQKAKNLGIDEFQGFHLCEPQRSI
jgi:diguanylate cyclase (GGDEF)-like protein